MTRPCSGVLSAASVSSTGGGSAVGFFEPLLFAFPGQRTWLGDLCGVIAAGRARRRVAEPSGPGVARVPGCDRRVRELPRVVLAPHADVRRALWRGLTKGAADRLLRARRAAGRRR